jgi:MFS transporter, FSR family, fosmidomycin resistance protein
MNNKRLWAASFGHFGIDILNSSIAMILTAVSGVFNLTISQIGLAAMIYTFAAALSQPLFGMLADYLRGRWLAAVGVLWTMIFYAAAPFMPNYLMLVACLTTGALGSGAFHPAGMVNAAVSGGRYPTLATSIFFLLGQTGLSLGPLLSGIVLQRYGLAGLPWIALAITPVVVFMFYALHQPLPEHAPVKAISSGSHTRQAQAVQHSTMLMVTAFVLLIAIRSTTMASFSTLLPKYFDELGYQAAVYGGMISVFTFGGALGTFAGGFLGDRFNRRMVIFLSTLAAVPFAYFMLHVSGFMFWVTAALAGALLNVPHSILLVIAQRLLPARKGMIGGAVLGFMFASGAAMAWVASRFADWMGLELVLSVLAIIPIIAGICALVLPSTRGGDAVAKPAVPDTGKTPAPSGAD